MSEVRAREAAGARPAALREGLARYFTPEELAKLRAARVGIAGAGGLGSNAALMLARSGVEDFLLVDDDVVDASNLNRQQFWPRHVGRPKVEALGELLRELNPHIRLELVNARLDEATLPALLPACSLWV
ncbi:MAG: ThiF family adenylyltransferase, partial [Desulfovibrio sp.]|nr:ThiF family adenylyltransferase [Desulfovibrio sp.]